MDLPIVHRRPGVLGAHSIDHFALEVPDLAEAKSFYTLFGLDVRDEHDALGLYAHGNPHRWATITQGEAKRLRYLCFGIFEDDVDQMNRRLDAQGAKRIAAPRGAESNGIWIEGFDGLPINLRVAEKCSPDAKSEVVFHSVGPGRPGTVKNSEAPKTHPRRLSHFALYTSDVRAATDYYEKTIGLRLSDSSGPLVAFMHGVHGSDHHLLALVSSDHRGMHHISWDVGSVQEVGLGSAQMMRAGFKQGWGVGRHVLGANYFYYVRDPWGSYSEYSADIDFIPHDHDWPSADHPPEDSFYLWGPPPPADFIENFEPLSDAELARL
jgi:catechol 2,3-dioxygenase-like lactoylglutathione lyase family enzyme